MSRDHEKMKASFEEMEVENKKCKELADRVKAEIIEVQRENETRRDESQKIESKLIEMSSESAYFKDLLEKGLVIRKDLERSVADERTARTKSEDALASAKTAAERIQEELDIVSKKYDEKQKEFDALKKETINFENQIESLTNELKSAQSRLEDASNTEGNEETDTGLGEAERKNLQERAEQAEDRALSVSFCQMLHFVTSFLVGDRNGRASTKTRNGSKYSRDRSTTIGSI